MDMQRIDDGYSVCAGRCGDDWYAGVLVLEDRELAFIEGNAADTYDERLQWWRTWDTAAGAPTRAIKLVRSDGSDQVIASADRIIGPVCPKEAVDSPVLAWTERHGDGWQLMLHRDGKTRTIHRRAGVLRQPQVAQTPKGLVLGVECDDSNGDYQTVLLSEAGNEIFRTSGAKAKLCAAGKDLLLLTEQPTPDGVTLKLQWIADGQVLDGQQLAEGDYLFNADIAWSVADSCAYIVGESTPALGYGNQIGLHRTIHVWQYRDRAVTAFPEGGNELPIKQSSFGSLGPENRAPIQAQVLLAGDKPTICFKRFRYFKHKTFGWDVLWSRFDGAHWQTPERLTPNLSAPDTSWAVLPSADGFIGFFPAHDNDGGPGRSTDFRVEIIRFTKDRVLPLVDVPAENEAPYTMPFAVKNFMPTPAALPDPYEGRTLIWGDLHVHTTHSQCVAAVDGNPEENIRFNRDVLGCKVFTLTEHTPWITGPNSMWAYDQLEAIAGDDGVVIYGSEPGMHGVRHTNWYTRDRKTFDRLQRIFLAQKRDLQNTMRHVREELPPGSVFMLRHFHGQPIPDEQIPQSFDSQLEVAMEAMQGRVNAMLCADNGFDKAPIFPTPFLNAGCKIGLVGGTDHYRRGPNHHCLTGFWVKDVSADGVWEALRNRYTIAMSDSRVAMATMLNGAPMGESVEVSNGAEIRVQVQASCGHTIRRAMLIRDGEFLPWQEIAATSATFELADPDVGPGAHWYVPTIEVETTIGDDTVGYCHASPSFVFIPK